MSIQVQQLSKFYGSQKAVDSISFEVGKGEILGFLGPNGAGKSTTMRMITGYIAPDQGEIRVLGNAVTPENTAIRRHIGYLPEHNPLYLDMYVREYLAYIARVYRLPAPAKRVDEVIRQTGLAPEAHKTIRMLSKGYRQRVGLAQAIIHDPEVLILDEPTSGLDPNQLLEIRALIKALGKNKTILLSTHIMQEVQALCDRVVIIDQGHIVADGPLRLLSQQIEGTFAVTVTFSRPVFDAAWAGIPGYRSHEVAGPNRYFVTGTDPLLNEHLFDFAVSKNLKILEMTAREDSIERIFQQLTSKGA